MNARNSQMLGEFHGRRMWRLGGVSILVGSLALGACDLGVDNPTMIGDTDLDSPEAVTALVAGVAGDFAEATVIPGGGGVYNAAANLTDELVHVGTWVGLRGLSDGDSRDDWSESQSRWAEPSQARWVAEQAIGRISTILTDQGEDPQSSAEIAEVTMWAGHANRVLGDNFCQAVIDGGPLEPHTAFYERALGHFDNAIAVADAAGEQDLMRAAIGGRAHVHMMLGDWDLALADAAEIPTDFVFNQIHHETAGISNDFRWWGYLRNENSVWGTPFADWGMDVDNPDAGGDPRVPYDISRNDDGEILNGGDGRRPFYRQLKYDSYSDPIAVVKGTEMRLLEAEAALVLDSDIGTMVDRINEVRAHHNAENGWSLPMLDAGDIADIDAAWEVLMRERGIELWLEGKRLPDLRRWADNPGHVPFTVVRGTASGQPASEDPRPLVLDIPVMQTQGDICIQISRNEKNSNRNIN